MSFELSPLPYPKDALQPYLSTETLEYHYGKHHKKYVTNLSELTKDTEYADQSLEQIITQAGDGPIFNNAAQIWNHDFYWRSLTPDINQKPEGELAEAIDSTFGSFEQFCQEFNKKVIGLFGSGWVWLVNDGTGVLSILATKDADNPLAHGRIALLTCDAWEHAFYIDYRNDKAKYMENYWIMANWRFAEKCFKGSG